MFYLLLGTNGFVIQPGKHDVEKCLPYIQNPTVHSYTFFRDAQADAMEILIDLLPHDYPLPDRIPQRSIVTVKRYFHVFPELEKKWREQIKKDAEIEELSSLEELDTMMRIEINT